MMVTHFRVRLYLLAILVMAGFSLLIYRLYQIQVVSHDYYAARVPGSKFESVRIPGIRGEIKDRNGITLVDSTPNYELQLDLREITAAYLKTHSKLPEPYTWERFDSYGQKEIKTEVDIVAIVEATVFPRTAGPRVARRLQLQLNAGALSLDARHRPLHLSSRPEFQGVCPLCGE